MPTRLQQISVRPISAHFVASKWPKFNPSLFAIVQRTGFGVENVTRHSSRMAYFGDRRIFELDIYLWSRPLASQCSFTLNFEWVRRIEVPPREYGEQEQDERRPSRSKNQFSSQNLGNTLWKNDNNRFIVGNLPIHCGKGSPRLGEFSFFRGERPKHYLNTELNAFPFAAASTNYINGRHFSSHRINPGNDNMIQ